MEDFTVSRMRNAQDELEPQRIHNLPAVTFHADLHLLRASSSWLKNISFRQLLLWEDSSLLLGTGFGTQVPDQLLVPWYMTPLSHRHHPRSQSVVILKHNLFMKYRYIGDPSSSKH